MLDKFAERVESGKLERELIGVYFNFQVKFAWSYGDDEQEEEYDELWETLTEAVPFHVASLPYGHRGNRTFEFYISSVQDEVMVIDRHGNQYWKGLSANFIAREPAKKPKSSAGTRVASIVRIPGDYLRGR